MFPETAFGFGFLPSARLWGAAGRIGGIESLGEPAVDRGKEVVGLGVFALGGVRAGKAIAVLRESVGIFDNFGSGSAGSKISN